MYALTVAKLMSGGNTLGNTRSTVRKHKYFTLKIIFELEQNSLKLSLDAKNITGDENF